MNENSDSEGSSTVDDDLERLDRVVGQLNLGAWDNFRCSFSAEKQEAVRRKSSALVPIPVVPEKVPDDEIDAAANENSFVGDVLVKNEDELVENERCDSAEWSVSTRWGGQEVDEIIQLLGLKNPKTDDCPAYWEEPTKKAISSIFFSERSGSLPLKRGEVVLGGEKHELMLFTNGFLFARADLDKLARREIRDYFRIVGKPLKGSALDRLMNQYDLGPDGTISQSGFESMLHFMRGQPKPTLKANANGFSWWSLGEKLTQALQRPDQRLVKPQPDECFLLPQDLQGTNLPLKLDVAFQVADIMKIENDFCCAHLTFALHLNEQDEPPLPVIVTCAESRHLEAWIEAFRTCMHRHKLLSTGAPSNAGTRLRRRSSAAKIQPSLDLIREDGTDASSQMMSGSEDDISTKENDPPQSIVPVNERVASTHHSSSLANPIIDECECEITEAENDLPKRRDSIELTDEETNDNAMWSLRLSDRLKFSRSYIPHVKEREEIEAIVDFLALHPDIPGQPMTVNAIVCIFFAERSDLPCVLLKRGPVLLNGEERELMIFTNGFLFSHVELDSIVGLLLDQNSEGIKNLSSEQLCERFHDIDADNSGELDRDEIKCFFQGIGMPLSEPAIDRIMKRYDLDSNGTISFPEFKSMMHELKDQKSSLRAKLRKRISRFVTQKLDVAYKMTDVEKIEHLGICHSSKTEIFADSEWASLTLAVHIKGKGMPLLVTCAKPGHVEAWMEAFRVCLKNSYLSPPSGIQQVDPAGMISGIPEVTKKRSKRRSSSIRRWYDPNLNESGSSVDWGQDDEE